MSLDEEWRAAEDALPEGWWITELVPATMWDGSHPGGARVPDGGWIVGAQCNCDDGSWWRQCESGPTPAAALHALAESFRS